MENLLVSNNNITGEDRNFFHNLNKSGLSGKPLLNGFLSFFFYFGLTIKVIALLTLSFIYFVIGGCAVILYIVFYERLFEKAFSKLKREKQRSSADINWESQNLKLKYEA